MKTAISIPDNVFLAAEETAKRLNIPRSQLYSKAVEEYISHHKDEYVTEKLNKIYSNKIDNESNLLDTNIQNLREATKNDTW